MAAIDCVGTGVNVGVGVSVGSGVGVSVGVGVKVDVAVSVRVGVGAGGSVHTMRQPDTDAASTANNPCHTENATSTNLKEHRLVLIGTPGHRPFPLRITSRAWR